MLWHKCFFFVAGKYEALSNVRSPRGLDWSLQTATCLKSFRGWKSVSWDSYNEGLLTDQLKKLTQISMNWKIIETHTSLRGQTNVKWNGIRTKQSNNKNNKPHFPIHKTWRLIAKNEQNKNDEEQKPSILCAKVKSQLKRIGEKDKKKTNNCAAPFKSLS